jgi:uncharacterized protein YPO0396
MLSLFSTSSDTAGFRLQYMEIYNWGTFDKQIFKIEPQGNNSLLTGANGSGKTTFIDALLTLLVPSKRNRFYNQSSGVQKKGDRSEESYVLGHYGDIQKEGDLSSTTQMLRNKNEYSVLLASFSNTDEKIITLFQVRNFSNGVLKRTFGISHKALNIKSDFNNFDAKGNWKKKLVKIHNINTQKKRIEYFDSPNKYAERMCNLFGMRSTKALSLFNQVVGIKVLGDLDDFIKSNMLEERDAETEYTQLKESFVTLMNAKNNIDKAKEQIRQLEPINSIANQLNELEVNFKKLQSNREKAVYWFANKGKELSKLENDRLNVLINEIKIEIEKLKTLGEELKNKETDLTVQIKTDEVGRQIEDLKNDIRRLSKSRDNRKTKLDVYNKLSEKLNLSNNPNERIFLETRNSVKIKRDQCVIDSETKSKELRLTENQSDKINNDIDNGIEIVKSLQKNDNNISGRVAQIREDILQNVGATKEEIPFIGELIKIDDLEWESSIEKVLHNFALRLIVPEKYYHQVNKYVNSTNLKGRIIYERYKEFASLKSMQNYSNNNDLLINKIGFKSNNKYTDWIEERIQKQFNYSCAEDLTTFNSSEKAITKEGLLKQKGRHEKDDRKHILDRNNYVLGWDNKEKINWWKKEIKKLQNEKTESVKEIRIIEKEITKIGELKDDYFKLFSVYTKFEEIDWETYATEIQSKEDEKEKLEKTNDKVKALQEQLEKTQGSIKEIEEEKDAKKEKEFNLNNELDIVTNSFTKHSDLLNQFSKNTTDFSEFEETNKPLLEINYSNFIVKQKSFQDNLQRLINISSEQKHKFEKDVLPKINNFKRPTKDITDKYKSWYSEVNQLPTTVEFISEYQKKYNDLLEEGLPKFELKFDKYLQETIENKVTTYRHFFYQWSDDIKNTIEDLNQSLKVIDFKSPPKATYIQLNAQNKVSENVKEFKTFLDNAIPNYKDFTSIDAQKEHFSNNIEPFIKKLEDEKWRNNIMDVRSWFEYKAEEFYREDERKFKTYSGMGQLSGGEKAQLTYTILGSAIAYQFGLTKEGLQSDSFRFIAIDEAFKAQDEDKARYLIDLCKQLHLQLLVVTPSDNIHIVENDISFVHYVERRNDKNSWLYDMPIEQFQKEKSKYITE